MAFDPAATRRLGDTGLAVSRLGFGTTALAGLFRATSEDDAARALDAAAAAGLHYIDTAPQYGHGLAEHRVGQALRRLDRERFVLSTKVGKLLRRPGAAGRTTTLFADALPFEIAFDYSYDGAMRSFEDSLQRLGTDRVDILLIHDLNRKYHGADVWARFDEARRGAWRALDELRRAGAVRAIGIALNELDVAIRFVEEAALDAVMLPARYTLLDQSAAATLLPLCEVRGVSVLAAAPFDSGILATGGSADAMYNYQPAAREAVERVRRIEALCARHGVPLAAAALQFPHAHPAVASVVAGMRSAEEVAANLRLMRTPIPEDFWGDLKRQGLLPVDAPVPTPNAT